jgi:hypothetical protein
VLDGVLQELVHDQRAGGRLLGREGEVIAPNSEANPLVGIEDALRDFGDDALGDLSDVDNTRLVMRQGLVHDGDREDSVDRLAQDLADLGRLGAPRLDAQQRGDRLQVVLDPVVDLLDHRRLDPELLLL